jgi:hypothetical protein
MIAAKTGYIADFKTGYLQVAIAEHMTEVMGGTDTVDGATGIAVSRLVKLTRLSDGSAIIKPATNVTATSIGDATHIVAQSDDSLRNSLADCIPVEQYSTRYKGILRNTSTAENDPTAATATMKTVALYKITDANDIKIIPIKPAINSVNR